jgi:hypothetical protein
MKKLCLMAIMFLSLLLGGRTVIADDEHFDFEVNFSGYEEGDIPAAVVAENVSIKTEIQGNGEAVNYLTSQSAGDKGKWTVNLKNLSGSFEILVEADFDTDGYYKNFTNVILFPHDSSNEPLKLFFLGYNKFQLNDNDELYLRDVASWKRGAFNLFKLKIEGNLAKFYINGEFVQSASTEPNVTYTSLQVDGLSSHERILSVKGKNVIGEPDTTPDPTSDCMATYTLDGKLHIPCVSVPGPFGGTQVYQVDLQQQGFAFTFDLDLNSVKPR